MYSFSLKEKNSMRVLGPLQIVVGVVLMPPVVVAALTPILIMPARGLRALGRGEEICPKN